LLQKMAHEVSQIKHFTDGVAMNARKGHITELFRAGRAFDTS